jgi:hypothetical protein
MIKLEIVKPMIRKIKKRLMTFALYVVIFPALLSCKADDRTFYSPMKSFPTTTSSSAPPRKAESSTEVKKIQISGRLPKQLSAVLIAEYVMTGNSDACKSNASEFFGGDHRLKRESYKLAQTKQQYKINIILTKHMSDTCEWRFNSAYVQVNRQGGEPQHISPATQVVDTSALRTGDNSTRCNPFDQDCSEVLSNIQSNSDGIPVQVRCRKESSIDKPRLECRSDSKALYKHKQLLTLGTTEVQIDFYDIDSPNEVKPQDTDIAIANNKASAISNSDGDAKENDNKKYIVQVSGSIPKDLIVSFSARYSVGIATADTPYCLSQDEKGKRRPKAIDLPLNINREGERYKFEVPIDKYNSGNCKWRFQKITATVTNAMCPEQSRQYEVASGDYFFTPDNTKLCPPFFNCNEDGMRLMYNSLENIPVEVRCRSYLGRDRKMYWVCQDHTGDYKIKHLVKRDTESIQINFSNAAILN